MTRMKGPGLFLLTMLMGLTHGPHLPFMASFAFADSLNAKPGAWELTTTTLTDVNILPPEALSSMSPEQRAKIEASMNARAGKPRTHVMTSCVTQKDLDQDRMIKSDGDDHCTKKIISKSANKLVLEQACPAPRASTSHMSVEAKTPESIVAKMDMVRGSAHGKVHMEITGRWIGASCAGIKGDE